jgi:hypothetical protein
MRYKNIIIFILAALFIFSSLLINSTPLTAADDEEKVDDIECKFLITMETPTKFSVNVTTVINYIDMKPKGGDRAYNNSQIAVEDEGTLGFIAGNLNIQSNLKHTFQGSNVNASQEHPNYSNGAFYSNYSVTLTTDFFDMNNNINLEELIIGILNMGGKVEYSFNLKAEKGWKNNYTFQKSDNLPAGFVIEGNKKPYLDGSEETTTELYDFNLNNESKMPVAEDSEEILLKFIIDSSKPSGNINSLKINISLININMLSPNTYDLPDYVKELEYVPADGMRLFIKNGFNNISWNTIKIRTIEPLKKEVKSLLENSSFNQTLDLSFKWDASTTTDLDPSYDIIKMGSAPAIKASLTDESVNLTICNISDKAFYGFINSGAETKLSAHDINFGDNLTKLYNSYDKDDLTYQMLINFPKNMTLKNLNKFSWEKPEEFTGEFESADAKNYDEGKKEIIIEIDLQNPRLNVVSFITGNTELEFDAVVKESRKYYVSDITNQTEYFPIPKKISLDYLCADAFRLGVEENVFSDENMSSFLNNEKNIFKQRTTDLWPGLKIGDKAKIDKKAFENSLNSEEVNIFDMDEYPAINVDSSAKIVKPIHFDLGFLPPSFKIEKQTFKIRGLEDQNITYRIIFPDGIKVKVRNSLIKDANVEKTKDGRTIVEFSFNSSEGSLPANLIDCELEASGVFILGMFMPCILTFIIAIILVIVIIFIKRKKGGRFRDLIPRRSKKEKFEEDGYEDEEFYVPPPPEGKK